MKHALDAWPWFKDIIHPLKRNFAEVLVISFFTNLLALAVPIFTLQVYDRVINHNAISTLHALALGVVLALIFDFVLKQARSRILQQNALTIDAVLGRKLYEKFTQLPLKALEAKPSSYWHALFADISLIRTVFSGSSAVLIADIPFAIIFVAVLFIIALPVAWVFLLIIPMFMVLTWRSMRVQNIDTAKEVRKQHSREGLVAELIAGRLTVKALSIDKAMQPSFETAHAEHIEQAYEKGGKTDYYLTLGQLLSLFTTVLLVLIGAHAIIARDMTSGALVATTMIASRIISPLNQLLASWRGFASCRQALIHLDTMFSQPGERQHSGLTRERPKGAISVEELSFSHDTALPSTLKNINFNIQPGEIIGIIGKNGCGKTTLIKLLAGLYAPESGRILLDGGDISQFSRKELTDWIGYVPQECMLFSGSIRDNIAKAWPDASDEAILAASKRAGADSFIIDLPGGYNTGIGEAGGRLSGGQRQRIAIARALLKQPPVLLFDEISSNLDSQAEIDLRNRLLELSGQHTIIMATHSLPLLKACHRILVLERGHLLAVGPAAAVLSHITGKDTMPPQHQEAQQQQ